jgi:hypothetical protein
MRRRQFQVLIALLVLSLARLLHDSRPASAPAAPVVQPIVRPATRPTTAQAATPATAPLESFLQLPTVIDAPPAQAPQPSPIVELTTRLISFPQTSSLPRDFATPPALVPRVLPPAVNQDSNDQDQMSQTHFVSFAEMGVEMVSGSGSAESVVDPTPPAHQQPPVVTQLAPPSGVDPLSGVGSAPAPLPEPSLGIWVMIFSASLHRRRALRCGRYVSPSSLPR